MWVSPNSLKADKIYQMNGVTINEYLLKSHNVNNIDLPTKRTHNFKGVVIHNTDSAKSSDDGRQYTAATLNNNVATRTHYYVTHLSAWRNLPDENMNWSCGDGTVGYGNNGCISLEIIMNGKTGENNLKARDNGAKIAAYILFKNNMTVNDMYTHNYFLNIRNGVTGDYDYLCTKPTPTRNCPYYIVWDWENFRKQVDSYIRQLGGQTVYDISPKEQYIFQACSQAAIRAGKSKNSEIVGRVTKGNYYLSEQIYNNWFKYYGKNVYSMLNDEGALFKKIGEFTIKTVTTNLNIRKGPTTASDKLKVVKANSKIAVAKEAPIKANGYSWYKVVIDETIGYAAGEFLK